MPGKKRQRKRVQTEAKAKRAEWVGDGMPGMDGAVHYNKCRIEEQEFKLDDFVYLQVSHCPACCGEWTKYSSVGVGVD